MTKSFIVKFLLIFNIIFLPLMAESVNTGQVEASLVSELSSIQPGQPFTVALKMKLAPHWHVYWINAGDAGAPPSIDWQLPEGFKAGDIQWPHPERIPFDDFINFGYEDDVSFLIEITPPADLSPGEKVTLRANADWLVCKDICIPESGELSLQLDVSANGAVPNDAQVAAFAHARAQLPIKSSDWKIQAAQQDTTLVLQATPPDWLSETMETMTFYPYEEFLIHNSAPQVLEKQGESYHLRIPLSPDRDGDPTEISGILVSESGWRGEGSEKALDFSAKVSGDWLANAGASVGGNGEVGSLWWALLFAFAGGMILNLMPCVLPVLSIKILGFVQQAGEDKSKVFRHGLMFMFGVLVSFWVLAGVLLLLRAGGEQLGWGFQLQSPAFVTLLSIFLFLFGLSLFGVFEIGTSLMSVGQGSSQSGEFGSFMSGVTATVVATPCTAPFMGGALGFALGQPTLNAMLIFTFLGLGMAAPYVLLASSPTLLKFVPKPGVWMDSLKQFMGFLLVATVIWLIWVFGSQTGTNAVSALLLVLMFSGMSAWILGRWGSIMQVAKTRRIAQILAVLITIVPTYLFLTNMEALGADGGENIAVVKNQGKINWQDFSPELVSELRQSGKPVFIDFTAKWCLSCQVNKKVAFGSSEVQDAFEKLGVNAVIADWTNYDETIAKALAEFNRNSVPLYVLYSPDPNAQPVILPELLTPGIVLDALEDLNN